MSTAVHDSPIVQPAALVRARARAPAGTVRVYVWDIVVRLTHWIIALSILLLAITGIYIGRPFLVVTGPAGEHFAMGTARILHFYGAIAFSVAVFARIAWMFVGKGAARWTSFIPITPKRLKGVVQAFQFYMFLRDRPPAVKGHNPLAGMMYLGIFTLYGVLIATGLAMYSVDADVGSFMRWFDVLLPLFGGAQTARWIHHVVMWVLLAIVIQHVYSAILCANVERNGTVDSIISGYKFLPPEEAEASDLE